jgi:DNA mismatch repair ATPase MutS
VNTGGGGTLTIQKGRYGIDVASSDLGTRSTTTGSIVNAMIPNDTYAPGHRNFTVLTGVNGSGKSTYLKQIAIIVVLAHCGSYVPAESAIVPVCF